MSYRFNVIETAKHPVRRVHKSIQHQFHSHLMIRNGLCQYKWFLSAWLMCQASVRQTDFLYNSFSKKVEHVIALHIKKLIFDR